MQFGLTVGDSIDRLDRTAEGFDFVEFGLSEFSPNCDEQRLESALDTNDVELCVHLPFKQVLSTPVPEINEAIVAHLRRLLSWAGSMGAHKAVLHGAVRNPYDTEQRDTFAQQLRSVVKAGRNAGVEVVVENVGHQRNGMQLSVLGELAEQVNASVCFDVGHAYMEEGNDGIKRFLKYHRSQISHLHVHDARRRGDTHIPVGAGEIDYSIVSNYLSEFDGTVAVEVFTDDVHHLQDTAYRVANALDLEFTPTVSCSWR